MATSQRPSTSRHLRGEDCLGSVLRLCAEAANGENTSGWAERDERAHWTCQSRRPDPRNTNTERGTKPWNNFKTDSAPRREGAPTPTVSGNLPPALPPGACAAPEKPRDCRDLRPSRDYSSQRPRPVRGGRWESRCVYRRGSAPPRERWRHPREPPSLPVGWLIFMSRARAGAADGGGIARSSPACLPP
ncbi:uncharacterized protein LOC143694539 [Agelaius phoeniceus]|uniref:uncharacterized protein LOC143694539 n=1 Tax=Agelaius phoeniceus TaxID=39638 RepID=UPI004054A20D